MSRHRFSPGYDRDYADCALCEEIIYRRHDWGAEHWVHLDVVQAHLAYPSDSDIARLAAEASGSDESTARP